MTNVKSHGETPILVDITRMKALMILAAVVLAGVAFMAFALATVRRESEVAMHVYSDEEFIRARITFIVVGVSASLLDLFLLWRLWRRRKRKEFHAA